MFTPTVQEPTNTTSEALCPKQDVSCVVLSEHTRTSRDSERACSILLDFPSVFWFGGVPVSSGERSQSAGLVK